MIRQLIRITSYYLEHKLNISTFEELEVLVKE